MAVRKRKVREYKRRHPSGRGHITVRSHTRHYRHGGSGHKRGWPRGRARGPMPASQRAKIAAAHRHLHASRHGAVKRHRQSEAMKRHWRSKRGTQHRAALRESAKRRRVKE